MEQLESGDLKIEIDGSQEALLALHWAGKSNHRNPDEVLKPFFSQVVELASQESRAVEMHFERLEHFNSSTISTLIHMIAQLRQRNVKLVLVFDGALKWQRLSFEALKVFERADDLLIFRTV